LEAGDTTAVIFDVDGTLVDSEREGHRVAFNRAFEEFGLPDRWGVDLYGQLLRITGGAHRLHIYLGERGMPRSERTELVPQLHVRKTRIFREMVAEGGIVARPGVEDLLRDLERAGMRLAVATTGTREWVDALLERLFGRNRFEVVVTGDQVPKLKPDPGAYLLALGRLGLPPARAVAIEDSRNGLLAARGAALHCIVVVNPYTRDENLQEAELVLDGFGSPGAEAAVLSDPHGLCPTGCLDAETVRRVRSCGPDPCSSGP
jgi:HAD superfamily hydrolase (TIGR01509 family)